MTNEPFPPPTLAESTWCDDRGVTHTLTITEGDLRYRRSDRAGTLAAVSELRERYIPAALPLGTIGFLRVLVGGIVDRTDRLSAEILGAVNDALREDGAPPLDTLALVPGVLRRVLGERRSLGRDLREHARKASPASARLVEVQTVPGESVEALKRRAALVELIDHVADRRAGIAAGNPEGLRTLAVAVGALGDRLNFGHWVESPADEPRLYVERKEGERMPETLRAADGLAMSVAARILVATVRALHVELDAKERQVDGLLANQREREAHGADLVLLRRHVRHALRRWDGFDKAVQVFLRVETIPEHGALAEQLRELAALLPKGEQVVSLDALIVEVLDTVDAAETMIQDGVAWVYGPRLHSLARLAARSTNRAILNDTPPHFDASLAALVRAGRVQQMVTGQISHLKMLEFYRTEKTGAAKPEASGAQPVGVEPIGGSIDLGDLIVEVLEQAEPIVADSQRRGWMHADALAARVFERVQVSHRSLIGRALFAPEVERLVTAKKIQQLDEYGVPQPFYCVVKREASS